MPIFAGVLNSLLGASCTEDGPQIGAGSVSVGSYVNLQFKSGEIKQPNPGAEEPPRRRRKAARRRSLMHASRVPTGRRTRKNEYLWQKYPLVTVCHVTGRLAFSIGSQISGFMLPCVGFCNLNGAMFRWPKTMPMW